MNENHERVLAIYLHNIERNLDKIGREFGHDGLTSDPVLSRVNCDISDDTRTELLRCSSIMCEEIGRIKDGYGFQPQNGSSKKRINAALTEIWTTINDLRPKRLENYGPLTEGDEEMLDSMILKLLVIVEEMSASID